MEQKDINCYAILSDNSKSPGYIQTFIDTISRLVGEFGDSYPMILFPTKLIKDLDTDDYEYMDTEIVMDQIVTQYGKDPEKLKREWDLYKFKPSEPILSIPSKKSEPQKREIDPYKTEFESMVPTGSFWIIILINIIFLTLSVYTSNLYIYLFLFVIIIPISIWLFIQKKDKFFRVEFGFVRRVKKSKKELEEDKRIADSCHKKVSAAVYRWNNEEWPRLVDECEKKYRQEMEEYRIKMENWEQYWKNISSLIDNEFPRAFINFIWNKINFSVEYNEEENPRRGSTEDKMLESLKKIGVKKLYRDISVKDYYPDFSIIDEYYFIDIEIDEPYIYDTNEPIHYIGSGDEERNKVFQDLGAFVIRFTEDQVRHSINICSKIVFLIQKFAETGNFLHLAEALDLSEEIRQKRWSFKKAQIMATYKYREK